MPARTYTNTITQYCIKSDAEVTPFLKLQIGLERSVRVL